MPAEGAAVRARRSQDPAEAFAAGVEAIRVGFFYFECIDPETFRNPLKKARNNKQLKLPKDALKAYDNLVPDFEKALKDDLDWVVVKALEKDRARRYQSASAVAEDLQRYRDSEPLSAGPPSPFYRLQKLVRRYRGAFAAAAPILLRFSEFTQLYDIEIAAVITYERNSWGNDYGDCTPEDVKGARK